MWPSLSLCVLDTFLSLQASVWFPLHHSAHGDRRKKRSSRRPETQTCLIPPADKTALIHQNMSADVKRERKSEMNIFIFLGCVCSSSFLLSLFLLSCTHTGGGIRSHTRRRKTFSPLTSTKTNRLKWNLLVKRRWVKDSSGMNTDLYFFIFIWANWQM